MSCLGCYDDRHAKSRSIKIEAALSESSAILPTGFVCHNYSVHQGAYAGSLIQASLSPPRTSTSSQCCRKSKFKVGALDCSFVAHSLDYMSTCELTFHPLSLLPRHRVASLPAMLTRDRSCHELLFAPHSVASQSLCRAYTPQLSSEASQHVLRSSQKGYVSNRPQDCLSVRSVRLKTSSTSDFRYVRGKSRRSVPGGAEGGPPQIFKKSPCTTCSILYHRAYSVHSKRSLVDISLPEIPQSEKGISLNAYARMTCIVQPHIVERPIETPHIYLDNISLTREFQTKRPPLVHARNRWGYHRGT